MRTLLLLFLICLLSGCWQTMARQRAYYQCVQDLSGFNPSGSNDAYAQGVVDGLSKSYCELMRNQCAADFSGAACQQFLRQF